VIVPGVCAIGLCIIVWWVALGVLLVARSAVASAGAHTFGRFGRFGRENTVAAATVMIRHYNGASGTASATNIDTGDSSPSTPKWGLDDATVSTAAITIPTVANTSTSSWYKALGFTVTVAGTTSIGNRKVWYDAATPNAMPGHAQFFFKGVAAGSYAQAASGNKPVDGTTGPSTPSGYTVMSTTPQAWDVTSPPNSISTATTGLKGDHVYIVFAVDNTYAGGANSATSLPNLHFSYDEA
jgi:hypothetical protein